MKYSKKYLAGVIALLLVIIGTVIIVVSLNKAEKRIGAQFFLWDVVVTEKYVANSEYRVRIHTEDSEYSPYPGDKYFSYPQEISVPYEPMYQALVPGIRYLAFYLDINMPYNEAVEKGYILTKEDQETADRWGFPIDGSTLNLDKVLNSVLDINRYCRIRSVNPYELDYYNRKYIYQESE